MQLMKVWLEADREKAHWQYDNAGRKSFGDIINRLEGQEVAQGVDVCNWLLEHGAVLVATHEATTGGVCSGIIALLDVELVSWLGDAEGVSS